jgi:hypothetical protein
VPWRDFSNLFADASAYTSAYISDGVGLGSLRFSSVGYVKLMSLMRTHDVVKEVVHVEFPVSFFNKGGGWGVGQKT